MADRESVISGLAGLFAAMRRRQLLLHSALVKASRKGHPMTFLRGFIDVRRRRGLDSRGARAVLPATLAGNIMPFAAALAARIPPQQIACS